MGKNRKQSLDQIFARYFSDSMEIQTIASTFADNRQFLTEKMQDAEASYRILSSMKQDLLKEYTLLRGSQITNK